VEFCKYIRKAINKKIVYKVSTKKHFTTFFYN